MSFNLRLFFCCCYCCRFESFSNKMVTCKMLLHHVPMQQLDVHDDEVHLYFSYIIVSFIVLIHAALRIFFSILSFLCRSPIFSVSLSLSLHSLPKLMGCASRLIHHHMHIPYIFACNQSLKTMIRNHKHFPSLQIKDFLPVLSTQKHSYVYDAVAFNNRWHTSNGRSLLLSCLFSMEQMCAFEV